jgi:archaeal type IV pilus assembly protein PilA
MMNRIGLFNRLRRERRSAISPIIATLLLILIAIAAGVVVYAYVLGFIGNSTGNSGNNVSVIQVSSFCMSASQNCNGGSMYVTLTNVGSVSISISTSSAVQLYFTDITKGTSTAISCPSITPTTVNVNGVTTPTTIAPAQSYTCSIAASGFLLGASYLNGAAGDSVSLKVVNPDSGQASGSTKVIS